MTNIKMSENLQNYLSIFHMVDIIITDNKYPERRIIIKTIYDELRKEFTMLNTFEIKPNFAYLSRKYDLDPRTIKKYYNGYDGKATTRTKPSQLDKYEEIKLISSKYNTSFVEIEAAVQDLLSKFVVSKDEINKTITTVLDGINGSLDELSLSFADLKTQILNKAFDEAFQTSVNNQIQGLSLIHI